MRNSKFEVMSDVSASNLGISYLLLAKGNEVTLVELSP